MNENNLNLLTEKYNSLTDDDLYDVNGGSILKKIFIIGLGFVFIMGIVNGCSRAQNSR